MDSTENQKRKGSKNSEKSKQILHARVPPVLSGSEKSIEINVCYVKKISHDIFYHSANSIVPKMEKQLIRRRRTRLWREIKPPTLKATEGRGKIPAYAEASAGRPAVGY
ncbi:MAG: hypothetical protein HYT37_02845 [Candidatus Sungbacteria bacterium]|nr:hypothetical protein [Candidatus Sungbacteria bacterium]